MINKIDFELPSFYITEPLVEETFEICRKDTTSPQVIKKLYMIKNDVKPDYHFADTGPETGFFLTAKVTPTFAIAGEARRQLEKEELYHGLLSENPVYKIVAKLYKEDGYKKVWEFEHFTKSKKEIYKTIIDLKPFIENIIKKDDIKRRKHRRIS